MRIFIIVQSQGERAGKRVPSDRQRYRAKKSKAQIRSNPVHYDTPIQPNAGPVVLAGLPRAGGRQLTRECPAEIAQTNSDSSG